MAAHLFNESGQMQEVDIPDIFDVLEGGEDENAVKFLLGFDGKDGCEQMVVNSGSSSKEFSNQPLNLSYSGGESSSSSESGSRDHELYLTKEGKPRKRDPVDPSRCVFSCESCDKAFTTKFNLKRHINLHCNKSKEAGVPVQGPPSASMPSRKARERRMALATSSVPPQADQVLSNKPIKPLKAKSKYLRKKEMRLALLAAQQSTPAVVSTTSPSRSPTLCTDQGHLQVQQAVAKGVHTKPSIVTYQLTGNQQISTSNNNELSPPQYSPSSDKAVSTTHQQKISDSNIQVIQVVPQNSQAQPRQYYQQQVVRVAQGAQQNQQGTIVGHLQSSNGSIPIIQQSGSPSVLQTIPISIVQGTGKNMVTRTIHLSPPSLGMNGNDQPGTTTVYSNGQITRIVKGTPFIPTNQQHQPSSSVVSSSYLPTSTTSMSDLSGPPDDLFDSEDGDASSVATTTEAPSPASLDEDMKSYTMISCEADNDDSMCVVSSRQADDNDTSTVHVTSTSNIPVDYSEDMSDDPESSNVSLNLPSNPPRGQIQEFPRGWLRKVITSMGQQKVFYYNNMGKKFSNHEEVEQYFARLGQTVKPGIFNFEPPRLVDEDDDDDLDDDLEDAATLANNLYANANNLTEQIKTQPLNSVR